MPSSCMRFLRDVNCFFVFPHLGFTRVTRLMFIVGWKCFTHTARGASLGVNSFVNCEVELGSEEFDVFLYVYQWATRR